MVRPGTEVLGTPETGQRVEGDESMNRVAGKERTGKSREVSQGPSENARPKAEGAAGAGGGQAVGSGQRQLVGSAPEAGRAGWAGLRPPRDGDGGQRQENKRQFLSPTNRCRDRRMT